VKVFLNYWPVACRDKDARAYWLNSLAAARGVVMEATKGMPLIHHPQKFQENKYGKCTKTTQFSRNFEN